jgi:biopolymer transport protein ExbD
VCRCICYGVCRRLTAGLFLLYDTYTFIKTDWSPLRIPMSVPVELIFGCALILAGIFTFFAPTLLSAISEIALDRSMKMGHQLVHESIELRRQQRLPLRTKFVSLPNRGLLGVVILPLLVPVFLSLFEPESTGIYVQLSPQLGQAVDENCLSGPILLRVKQHDGSSRVVLDGQEIQWSELRPTLISKLSGRANWEVFVEADEDVELSIPVQTFEIIRSLGAKAVILTPTLKKQLVDSCMSLLQVD